MTLKINKFDGGSATTVTYNGSVSYISLVYSNGSTYPLKWLLRLYNEKGDVVVTKNIDLSTYARGGYACTGLSYGINSPNAEIKVTEGSGLIKYSFKAETNDTKVLFMSFVNTVVNNTYDTANNITLTFYKVTRPDYYLTKINVNTSAYQYTGTFAERTSILKPVIKLYWGSGTGRDNDFKFNYVYIPNFQRYYYITDVVYEKAYIYVYCEVDVLQTYRTMINNSLFYCRRSENYKDAHFYDSKKPVMTKRKTQHLTALLPNGNYFVKPSVNGVNTIVRTKTTTPYPNGAYKKSGGAVDVNIGSALYPNTTQGIYLAMTPNELKSYVRALSSMTKEYQDLIQYSITMPVDFLTYGISMSSATSHNIYGWGKKQGMTDTYEIISNGTYSARDVLSMPMNKKLYCKWAVSDVCGAYYKKEPYAQFTLYLPFVTPIHLCSSDFSGGDYLQVFVAIDVYTGQLKYYINVDGDTFAEATAQIGQFTSYTSGDSANVQIAKQQAINNTVANGVSGAMVGAIGGATVGGGVGAMVGVVGGAISSAIQIGAMAEQYNINTGTTMSTSSNGGTVSCCDDFRPYILCNYVQPVVSNEFYKTVGGITEKSIPLSTSTGMVWGDILLSLTTQGNSARITKTERDQIRQLFVNGVYLIH